MKAIALKIADIGPFNYGKSLAENMRLLGHIPVYGSSGICGYHNESVVKNAGIIVGRKGNVGSLYFSKEPFFPIDTVFYVDQVKKGFSLKFYYYFLSQIGLKSMNSDAAVPGLNRNWVHSLKVNYPDESIQNKVAAILSAYDELIENNQRRIALLEKMAEEIYREWFVRLRFPGYERVKKGKGVPEGWEVRTLASFASEIKKGIKKKNLADAGRYLGLEHIPRRSISIKEWATASTVDSDKLLFQDRDILFGKIRPYLHKVALAHFSGACSSDTIVLRPKEKFYEGYLLFTVFSDTFIELATVASKGTKMPRADWGFLKQLELAVPDVKLLKMFQTKFELLFSQIVNLLRANEVLTASRDLLLPRLISGKLSVEHLDIQFPPGMEESACV